MDSSDKHGHWGNKTLETSSFPFSILQNSIFAWHFIYIAMPLGEIDGFIMCTHHSMSFLQCQL